ncbi:hypothetical protein ACFU5O_37060 [Streptomyces sp. NPDC057445]|uniref:hypothetical protein n=1 Tax=Streptomyces sp. NPDC057445 TaxID=3346136 RepID=UPI0036BB9439
MEDYLLNLRPRYRASDRPALWLTERGGRLQPREIEDRFAEYRDALGMGEDLTPHCLRHSCLHSVQCSCACTTSAVLRRSSHSWSYVSASAASQPVVAGRPRRCHRSGSMGHPSSASRDQGSRAWWDLARVFAKDFDTGVRHNLAHTLTELPTDERTKYRDVTEQLRTDNSARVRQAAAQIP